MRAVIFANGVYNTTYLPQTHDLVIAADGGAHHCLKHGISPAVVIGDLDSLEPRDLDSLKAQGADMITYPTRKDFTDLELAIDYALGQQPNDILILAGLGGRWDQTLANLLLAARPKNIPVRLLDGNQEFNFLQSGSKLELIGHKGDIVSLIPLGGDALGISTQGLEYPLDDEPLYFGSSRGISNVMVSDRATISLHKGVLLCTIFHSEI